ncbi:MAG: hypothetical protein J5615_09675, partial [Fibrobacter sp.]|nr:hypothetical protein [Fibrobacter sp.]
MKMFVVTTPSSQRFVPKNICNGTVTAERGVPSTGQSSGNTRTTFGSQCKDNIRGKANSVVMGRSGTLSLHEVRGALVWTMRFGKNTPGASSSSSDTPPTFA